MGRVLATGLLLASACGRLGFDPGEETPDAPPPGPALLACGAAPSFALGALGLEELSVVATAQGFTIASLDDAKNLYAWAYALDGDALIPAGARSIDADITGGFGAAAIGDDVVVAAVHGALATLGTTYHALDGALAARAPASVRAGRVLGLDPIAASGVSPSLASIRYEGTGIAVDGLDLGGTEIATGVLGYDTEVPDQLAIAPAGTGYAIAWVDTMASPNATKVALLDESLQIVTGPITIAGADDTILPRVRWAPTSNSYAVAWFQKAGAGDDVYIQLFDAALQPKLAPKLVQAEAVVPRLATDGSEFWLGYINVAATPARMDVARVALDGAITIRTAASGGGEMMAFAMVERAGQPVLVYAEAGLGGATLWFDPLCR